jgi:integrase
MPKLTVKELQSLKQKDVGRRIVDGNGLSGLVKLKGNSVSVSFRWRYRFDGKHKDYSCGTWPSVSLADIRSNRDDARRIHESGKDPAYEKQLIKQNAKLEQAEVANLQKYRAELIAIQNARMTVLDLFKIWQKKELCSRKDGGAEVSRSFHKDVFPAIGDIPVEEIKRSMITDLLYNVVARGANVIARNLLGDLRQMFGFAILCEYIEHDPTSLLKRDNFGKKNERERILSDTELNLLSEKLNEARMSKSSVACIWLMLVTCCRVGEICQAKWENVNFDLAEWKIPPENSKNGKEHLIYLSKFALKQFQILKLLSGNSPWVLPARWTDGHVNLKSLTKQIGDRQRMGKSPMKCRSLHTEALALPGGRWTPHDLRRTGATIMGNLGIRPDVIEKCLNHVEQNKLVRIYQRQKLEVEQLDAWIKLGEYIEKFYIQYDE